MAAYKWERTNASQPWSGIARSQGAEAQHTTDQASQAQGSTLMPSRSKDDDMDTKILNFKANKQPTKRVEIPLYQKRDKTYGAKSELQPVRATGLKRYSNPMKKMEYRPDAAHAINREDAQNFLVDRKRLKNAVGETLAKKGREAEEKETPARWIGVFTKSRGELGMVVGKGIGAAMASGAMGAGIEKKMRDRRNKMSDEEIAEKQVSKVKLNITEPKARGKRFE